MRGAGTVDRRRRAAWLAVIGLLAALTVARNLIGLDSAPAGAYVDETSIGYNAWAIATHGVDEHGAHLPLYFTAFGEFKNPVYVYTLSALLRVLPLTVTTERLPAAFFGILTCLLIALLAWRRSRSLPVTAVTLGLAALTPWLTVESRVGFEVISIVALLSGTLLCLSLAQDTGRWGWYAAAGVTLGMAVFAYSTGRVAVALFGMALVAAHGWRDRHRLRMCAIALVPVAAAYAVLGAWSAIHPGAITARFNAISIFADGAPLLTVAARFIGNYVTYFGLDFLFVSGDHNPRHNTQFGGMLLWVALPLLAAGLVAAWRAREQPYMRFLVLGVMAAPVSAALTDESVPHAVRAAVTLPFLLALCVEGLSLVAAEAQPWRAVLLAGAAVAVAVQGGLFTADLYGAWPARSALAFDAGEIDAISRAAAVRGSTPLLLSVSLDQPYIQASFRLLPPPPGRFVEDSATPLLASMGMAMYDPQSGTAPPGSVVVLSAGDPVPPGARLLFGESAPDGVGGVVPTIAVYRIP